MSIKCLTTHHTGCPCHESMWINRLDTERKEIVSLRMSLYAAVKTLREIVDTADKAEHNCYQVQMARDFVQGIKRGRQSK